MNIQHVRHGTHHGRGTVEANHKAILLARTEWWAITNNQGKEKPKRSDRGSDDWEALTFELWDTEGTCIVWLEKQKDGSVISDHRWYDSIADFAKLSYADEDVQTVLDLCLTNIKRLRVP